MKGGIVAALLAALTLSGCDKIGRLWAQTMADSDMCFNFSTPNELPDPKAADFVKWQFSDREAERCIATWAYKFGRGDLDPEILARAVVSACASQMDRLAVDTYILRGASSFPSDHSGRTLPAGTVVREDGRERAIEHIVRARVAGCAPPSG